MLRSFQKTVMFSALDVEENLIVAGQMFTFPGLWSTFGVGAVSRAARSRPPRTRARTHPHRRALGCASPAGQATSPAVSKSYPVRVDADAGAEADSPRRADGRDQPETNRARGREHPICQSELRRQLPGHRAQYRRHHDTVRGDRARSGPKAGRGNAGEIVQNKASGRPISVASPNFRSRTCVPATARSRS